MKSWQVFIFSLIPLALVFIGVIGGSIHGSDSVKEEFPTPIPTATGEAPTPVPGTSVVNITAKDIKFDIDTITVTAGQPVQVIFDNQDAGVLHNVAFYASKAATQIIYQGAITTGVVKTTYEFTAPIAGTYFFRCDVHPDTMTGTFVVQ